MCLCASARIFCLLSDSIRTHRESLSVSRTNTESSPLSLSLSLRRPEIETPDRQTDKRTNGPGLPEDPPTVAFYRLLPPLLNAECSPRFVLPPSATITQFLNLFRHSVHGSSRVCRRRRRTHSLTQCSCVLHLQLPKFAFIPAPDSLFLFLFLSLCQSLPVVPHCSVLQFCSIIITVTVEAAAAKERENDSSLARRH